MPLTVDVENKKVFTTPHATVVLINGQVTSIKVCRPGSTQGATIKFESYTEFTEFVVECNDVFHAVDKELNQ